MKTEKDIKLKIAELKLLKDKMFYDIMAEKEYAAKIAALEWVVANE